VHLCDGEKREKKRALTVCGPLIPLQTNPSLEVKRKEGERGPA